MRRRFDGEPEQDQREPGEAMFAVRRFFGRETE